MTEQKKIEALEEMFEVDAGALTPETALDKLQWDSMAMLSLVALADKQFGKRLSGSQLKASKTIQDLLDVME